MTSRSDLVADQSCASATASRISRRRARLAWHQSHWLLLDTMPSSARSRFSNVVRGDPASPRRSPGSGWHTQSAWNSSRSLPRREPRRATQRRAGERRSRRRRPEQRPRNARWCAPADRAAGRRSRPDPASDSRPPARRRARASRPPQRGVVEQPQDHLGEIVDVEQRKPRVRHCRHEQQARLTQLAEDRQRRTVARAIDRGRPQDAEIDALAGRAPDRVLAEAFALGIGRTRPARARPATRSRGSAVARVAAAAAAAHQPRRPDRIDQPKRRWRVGACNRAGAVHDRRRARDQLLQGRLVLERAHEPQRRRLARDPGRCAGSGPEPASRRSISRANHLPADESGATGDGDRRLSSRSAAPRSAVAQRRSHPASARDGVDLQIAFADPLLGPLTRRPGSYRRGSSPWPRRG